MPTLCRERQLPWDDTLPRGLPRKPTLQTSAEFPGLPVFRKFVAQHCWTSCRRIPFATLSNLAAPSPPLVTWPSSEMRSRWTDVLREMPCQCIASLSRVTSGTSWFLWTMATRLSQYHANFLRGLVRWYGCETATGRPRQHHQAKIGLPRRARPHGSRVSSEWVGTRWRHAHVTAGLHSVDLAYVWTRTAHCSATLSATLSSLTSEVLTQAQGSTVADVPCSTEAHTRFCDDPSSTVVPYRCQESHSQVHQQQKGTPGIVVE